MTIFLQMPLPCQENHFRIDIKGIYAGCHEVIKNEIDSAPRSAANLKDPSIRYGTAYFQQLPCLKMLLQQRPEWTDDEKTLDKV